MDLAPFFTALGKPKNVAPLPPASLKKYEKLAPKELVALWKQHGSFSVGDGLLWINDPGSLADPLSEFGAVMKAYGLSKKAFVFARGAFGHLYVWDKGHAWSFDAITRPPESALSKVTDNLAFLFNDIMTMPALRERILHEPLFKKAKKKLGALGAQDAYTVNPLPALGGSLELKHLKVGKLREYLSIASQLNG